MSRELMGLAGAGPTVAAECVVIETCHSIWSFDIRNHRFRRVVKGLSEGPIQAATEWRPFYRVEERPGSDVFCVWLNPEGTRLIRSYRHRPGCPVCARPPSGPDRAA